MLKEIIDIVHQVKGNEELFLTEPIKVKLSPHTQPFEVWGLSVSPTYELYVMDSSGQWNKLEETDVNGDKMIASIYQRVRIIFKIVAA